MRRRWAWLLPLLVPACQALLGRDDPAARSDRADGGADANAGEDGAAPGVDAAADTSESASFALPRVVFARRGSTAGPATTQIVLTGLPADATVEVTTTLPPYVTAAASPAAVTFTVSREAALTPTALPLTVEARTPAGAVLSATSRLYVADDPGALDKTFGDAGVYFPPCADAGDEACGYVDMSLDALGRLVLAGAAQRIATSGSVAGNSLVTTRMRVVASGELDPSFATAATFRYELDAGGISAEGLMIDDANRSIVSVTRIVGTYSFQLLRLDADGRPDSDFGTEGFAFIRSGGASTSASTAPDGDAGYFVATGPRVFRLDKAGGQLNGFAGDINGLKVAPEVSTPTRLVRWGEGALAVRTNAAAAATFLTRFDFGGGLATLWGDGGLLVWGGPEHASATGGAPPANAAVGADGRLYAIAASRSDAGARFAIARLDDGGAFDPAFADAGVALLPAQPGGVSFVPQGISLQPDGKVLVVGTTAHANNSERRLVLARLMPDGTPDGTFGSEGYRELQADGTGNFKTYGARVTVDPDGRLLVLGSTVPQFARHSFVARFWP